MQRLIDANALSELVGEPIEVFLSRLDLKLPPTIDAEPVRHGKWIVWDEIIAGIYHTVSECSECGFTTDKMYRSEMLYCPRCGARMDKE